MLDISKETNNINDMEFYSQHQQDKFIVEYFKSKKNGTFVDIGAHDGITLSNTYTLETELGWNGICVEPMEHEFKKLEKCRTAKLYNCACYDTNGTEKFTFIDHDNYPDMLSGISKEIDPRHMYWILTESKNTNSQIKTIEVQTRILNEILEENKMYEIDFMSVDTEGSEFKIIKAIDFNRFKIKIIITENGNNDSRVQEFLKSKEFTYYKRLGIDDVFINKNLKK
jgi:FkbM family methyltransferase